MTDSARADPRSELIGREAETAVLDSLLDRLPDEGAAVLVSGAAGIGKSALLGHSRRRAEALGLRTLATVGVESEAELAFAGLHQLVRPIAGLIEGLPGPQRRALEAAFGLSDEVAPDRFHVALAAHRLLCDAAASGATILFVDDAHWLDRSTLDVLTFIARRLDGEPLALVVAVREEYVTPLQELHLRSLELGRLSAGAAADLLDRDFPDLHPVARARVLAEAAGNPLALVELSRSLPQAEAAREALNPAPPTLTARLERAFAARLKDLPSDTHLVLLMAALDGRASLDELVRGASRLHPGRVALSALDAAVEADLVEVVDMELRFHHPLIRSALRQDASPAQLLAAYEALAGVVDDPERQLWHRAMSAPGPDEDIAVALEQHATAARRRGAVTVAAAALERAAALSVDSNARGERMVRAAEAAYELGRADVVRRLLEETTALELGSLETARLAWLQQMTSGDVWVEAGAAKTFVTIAQQMRDGGDADMALRALVPIAHRCWWTRTRAKTRRYVVDAAGEGGVPDDDPRLLAVVALADPEETGPSVLRRIAPMKRHELADPLAAMHVGIAAEKAGDFALGSIYLARAVERLREQGRLGALTQALVHYAWVTAYTGEWETSAAVGLEAAGLARDTRQPEYGVVGRLIAAMAEAMRGDQPSVEATIMEAEQSLPATRAGPMLAPAHLARAAAALGEGRHEAAFRHLWPVFDEASPAFHRFMRWPAILDLVEAGVRSGQTRRLTSVVGSLSRIAERSEPPILRAGLACARPLLVADEQAEQLFALALRQDLSGLPVLRARTLFSLGCWLRRRRRSVDSRRPLGEAIALFDSLGAAQWAQRARQELRATGQTIGPRAPDARDRLTAQELQIAELAAEGLTNREIGERLFLSHRTIGSHLYRIFPKLDITSRAQLRDALGTATVERRAVI